VVTKVMAYRYVKRKAEEAYRALIDCVRTALEEENAELAVICGASLVKMGEVEKGSYIYEYPYVNEAMELGIEVVKLAEREGVPSWLEKYVDEMKRILEDAGYEIE